MARMICRLNSTSEFVETGGMVRKAGGIAELNVRVR